MNIKEFSVELAIAVLSGLMLFFINRIFARFDKIDEQFGQIRADIVDLKLDIKEIKTQQSFINDHFLPEPPRKRIGK